MPGCSLQDGYRPATPDAWAQPSSATPARESGYSVFVDADLQPHGDQWAFLASIEPMVPHDIEPTILRATGGTHPLDVTFIDDEDLATPWKREANSPTKLAGAMPEVLTVTLANLIYFQKCALPQALVNRLIRLAAFQNPEFYKAQAMRMSVWDKPRVIGDAENYPQHIALPRGCLDAALALLKDNGIHCNLQDERRVASLLMSALLAPCALIKSWLSRPCCALRRACCARPPPSARQSQQLPSSPGAA
jgi:hypothetical protein